MRDRLETLAKNLWWCWDAEATALFAAIDPDRWEEVHHNPLALLAELDDTTLLARVDVAKLKQVEERAEAYLHSKQTWAGKRWAGRELSGPVAYFSMEFALHESLPIYSGGLGVLAGDHLKSASDLGIPFIGITLLYREGYFKQVIANGRQVAAYPLLPLDHLPLKRTGVKVEIPFGHHSFFAEVWELAVGRARLLLLDTDLEENPAQHRFLSQQLYGGDTGTRIAQEVVLGVGGVRALRALGLRPSVFHLNEGHCAFAPLELWKEEIDAGKKPSEAFAATKEQCVFTTHTPVPAGHDRFGWEFVKEALGGMREQMGLQEGAFMDLGRVKPGDLGEPLCMTVLALRASRHSNGVSQLHGEVSREMWKELYRRPVDEVPIGAITNGVHGRTWMHPAVQALLAHHAPKWEEGAPITLARVSAGELWGVRQHLRASMVRQVQRLVGKEWLQPEVLTLGFARRFAPYKRGNLLFTEPDRLHRLLADAKRPVQILFAGKAHPRDTAGQGILSEVVRWTRDPRFRGRVLFLSDYDMALARVLVQGVDVWLNTPRRPREASGTSGMKVAMNLGLNCSVLDGWWPEAYDGTNGWAVGEAKEYATEEAQDHDDGEALYRVLEQQLTPEFYDRDAMGVPQAWVQRMRRSVESCAWAFHTHRMVQDYATKAYQPE